MVDSGISLLSDFHQLLCRQKAVLGKADNRQRRCPLHSLNRTFIVAPGCIPYRRGFAPDEAFRRLTVTRGLQVPDTGD